MLQVKPYTALQWPDVKRIYEEGIATKLATFETQAKTQEAWETGSLPGSSIVCMNDKGSLLGWATLWPVSDRCVYAGVAEVSIYVGADSRGKGAGKTLLNELVTISEQLGIWTLQAGIFPENTASIALHEKCGFRVIGVREKLGAMDGEWKDVVLMERRSKTVGN